MDFIVHRPRPEPLLRFVRSFHGTKTHPERIRGRQAKATLEPA